MTPEQKQLLAIIFIVLPCIAFYIGYLVSGIHHARKTLKELHVMKSELEEIKKGLG